ncbi:MAG: glutamate-cysteine ligase family protein [Legionella sp.]
MSNFPIFSVLGIEIEYMLVDKDSLDVRPISDILLRRLAGHQVNEVAMGDIALSNELVMHVLELKNNGPKPPDSAISQHFQHTINALQPLLAEYNLILLPTGAHPWMDPHRETVRWPHGSNAIYQQFDTIFNCQGHGWANLQSMHVNMPYASQDEFRRLHSLIRLILPLLPALAASSPILDGKSTGLLDSRLHYYSQNQKHLPTISGDIIPEYIQDETEYQHQILAPMYDEISPFDPEKILQHQWLNSRAAIAKLDQKAIEIRIIDSQECVDADIAIAKAIQLIIKNWHDASNYYLDNPCPTAPLKKIFDQAIVSGLSVRVDSNELMSQWQLPQRSMTLGDVWSQLIERASSELSAIEQRTLEHIISHGNLSERILKAIGPEMNKASLKNTYQQLAHCLLSNQQFSA